MKFNHIFSLLLMIMIAGTLQAQRPAPDGQRRESKERIEAQRVAFITQKLSFTPEEAAKFWPVYNHHKDAMKDLRDDIERPDLMNVTNDEANIIIERHLDMEEQKLALKRDLYKRLRGVITPQKILMLHAAEREFNRERLRRAQNFRRE